MRTSCRHCKLLWEIVEDIGLGKRIVVVENLQVLVYKSALSFAEGRDDEMRRKPFLFPFRRGSIHTPRRLRPNISTFNCYSRSPRR